MKRKHRKFFHRIFELDLPKICLQNKVQVVVEVKFSSIVKHLPS